MVPNSMLSQILTKEFYGNPAKDWMQAALIIVGALVLGKLIYWLIGKTIKRLASKTRTPIFPSVMLGAAGIQ